MMIILSATWFVYGNAYASECNEYVIFSLYRFRHLILAICRSFSSSLSPSHSLSGSFLLLYLFLKNKLEQMQNNMCTNVCACGVWQNVGEFIITIFYSVNYYTLFACKLIENYLCRDSIQRIKQKPMGFIWWNCHLFFSSFEYFRSVVKMSDFDSIREVSEENSRSKIKFSCQILLKRSS